MSVQCLTEADGRVVCKFDGKMDTLRSIEVGAILEDALQGAETIIFDLAGVDYIASSFLRICAMASRKVASGQFSIINLAPGIKKVFKIAGLAQIFKID